MITYLQKDLYPQRTATFDEPLDPALYDNIGSTAEDYHAGLWLPLTEEQAQFLADHPAATVEEILACALTVYVPTLEEVKQAKLAEITAYDTSSSVNAFSLGGRELWLDKATRVGLANSIAIEEAAGREFTTLWFGGECYTIPIASARQMLAALELYALACYNVTESHRAAVRALDTAEAVNAYDHTAGYPAHPDFEL